MNSITTASGREIPVASKRRYPAAIAAKRAAEALFSAPRHLPPAKPRILSDNSNAPLPLVAVSTANETEHNKVFRLVREQKFEEAARIAARLINAGDVDGFFVHGGTPAYNRASVWFKARIAAGKISPETGFETITPEKAQVLLLSNKGNRKVRASNLALVMRDIASGRWEKNGETLIVSDDGQLNDGQHRNFAVLLTARAIETAMAFGVTRESIATVDIGVKRTGGDRLGFLEIKNYSRIAAIVALAHKVIEGRVATESEKVFFYRDNADLLQDVANISNNLPRGSSGASFGSAAFLLLRAGHDAGKLSDFFSEIRGVNVPKRKNSPATKLREALLAKAFKASAEEQVFTVADMYLKWASGKSTPSVTIMNSMPNL